MTTNQSTYGINLEIKEIYPETCLNETFSIALKLNDCEIEDKVNLLNLVPLQKHLLIQTDQMQDQQGRLNTSQTDHKLQDTSTRNLQPVENPLLFNGGTPKRNPHSLSHSRQEEPDRPSLQPLVVQTSRRSQPVLS